MDASPEHFESGIVLLIVFGVVLALYSALQKSRLFFFLASLNWVVLYVFVSADMYTRIVNPLGSIITFAAVPLFFFYLCITKFLFNEDLLVPIDYRANRVRIYQRYGRTLSSRVVAEMPILAAMCFTLGLIVHLIQLD